MSLTVRILIGLVAGFVVGSVLFAVADEGGFLRTYLVDGAFFAGGEIFKRMLMMLVVPLVLVSLVCGASNISDGAKMGRIGGKAVVLYLATTAAAVSLALLVALAIGPGKGMSLGDSSTYAGAAPPSFVRVLIDIFPSNPIKSLADGKMLQIIVFALLLGTVLARIGEPGARVKQLFEDLNVIVMRLVSMIIALAPYGVFCLMAKQFADVGWNQIISLGMYFGTVVLVLVLHLAIVYPTLLLVFGRLSPRRFFVKLREPMLLAFSTSSSGATLPVTLRTVEKRIGVSNDVASFTLPLGATINMDGTAIMQGVATVFIAQLYVGGLDAAQLLTVVLMATLASVGTAAVPSAGIIMLTMVLTQVGLPLDGIALILGVDRLLDMMRTSVNVAGDCTVSTVIARSEGQLDMDVFNDPDAGSMEPEAPRPTMRA